jgi:hypothetical protein
MQSKVNVVLSRDFLVWPLKPVAKNDQYFETYFDRNYVVFENLLLDDGPKKLKYLTSISPLGRTKRCENFGPTQILNANNTEHILLS